MSKSKAKKQTEEPAETPTEPVEPLSPEGGDTPPVEVQPEEQVKLNYPVKYQREEVETPAESEPDFEGDDEVEGEAQEEAAPGFTVPNIDAESYQALQAEYAETGQLSEKAYEYLQEAGYSKEFVDQHLTQGAMAQEAARTAMYKDVGGPDVWNNEIAPWAKQNLTEEQIKSFDAQLLTKDPVKISAAMAEIAKAKAAAEGSPASLRIEGKRPSSTGGVKPYQSPGDFQNAVGDPRWGKDTEYTEMVRARARVTKQRGMPLT